MKPEPETITSLRDVQALDLPPLLAPEYVRAQRVLPIALEDSTLTVVAPYDRDEDVEDDLRVAFGVPRIRWLRAPEGEVDAAIERALAKEAGTVEDLVRDLSVVDDTTGLTGAASLEDLTSLANQPPVVKLVNLILLEALEARASDVHLESEEAGLTVRYRVDGVLEDAPSPPARLRDAIISRVKVMANLDVAERRAPQDGRVRLRLRDREIDVRVSTLPAIHGESVALRLLDPGSRRLSLEDLGMDAETLARFDSLIGRPHGMILVSGPTGSGKTTTLYAALERIRSGREKIVTVEDPVEYRTAGITQIQVNRAAGVTFATALRSILRHDPDVVLVGEIRDPETAEIAVHAALTGHLVLSTVHTNDAATGITRLLDLGVAEYLVASSVHGILAQRLVRRLCTECGVSGDVVESAGGPDRNDPGRGRACGRCRGTGYYGRLGIFELLVMDEDLRRDVLSHRGSSGLRELARRKGMRTLQEEGLEKVAAQVTTRGEIERAARES